MNSRGFSGALIYPLVVAILILSTLAIPMISNAAPGVPYNVSVDRFSASNTALTISWNNIGFGAGSGNRIWMNGQVKSFATSALNVTYMTTGLSPGVNYVFKVSAYDNTGYSDYSFPAAAITKTSAANNSFQMPHATFMDSSNMCSSCHSVHKARTKYKALKFRYSNLTAEYDTPVSGAPSQMLPAVNLCFNCHDGQGAQYNAKKFYDQPTSANVPWPGHMTRRASTTASEASFGGWRYIGGQPAGQRQPCMICHDVHVSSKGNWKSLADGLVDYAVSASGGWNTGASITSDAATTGKIDLVNNLHEKCVVCHHDNSMTNAVMKVAGRDMFWPNSSNGTPAGQLVGTKDHTGITGQTPFNCGCHVSATDINAQTNVHALGSKPGSPQVSCIGPSCHQDVVDRTMSASFTSRHYIASIGDNTVPNANTCVGKCHNNHGQRTPFDSYNLYTNAPSLSGAANYDYTAAPSQSAPGLCLSCHQNVQSSQITVSNSTKTVSAIAPTSFASSAHSYISFAYGTMSSRTYAMSCIKCHRDNSTTTTYSRWGPHASSNRSLLWMPTTGQAQSSSPGNSEILCFECHQQRAGSPSGNDYWAQRPMATVAWRISQAFNQNKNWGHSAYLLSTSLDRHRASEGGSPEWSLGTAKTSLSATPSPTSVGFYDLWTAVGGTKVGVVTDNNDATYIETGTNGNRQLYNLTATGLPASSQIDNVTVKVKYYVSGRNGELFNIIIRSGSTDDNGSNIASTSAPVWYSRTMTNNPATGQPWTVSEIDALQVGVRDANSRAGNRATEIQVEVYTVVAPASRHVECYDCHNPHQVSQGYNYNAALPYTGSANELETPKKGFVSNVLRGVWGIFVNNWNSIPTAANYYTGYESTYSLSAFTYTSSASKQAYICIKCHSPYAYGTGSASKPAIPSGVPDNLYDAASNDPDVASGNDMIAGNQSDIVADFNPNNIGYHPVFSPGRNQPAPSLNSNWSGANGRNSASYDTPGTNPGLTTAFVPPWGASSLVTCSDCHSHNSSSYSRGYYTSAASVVNTWGFPRGPHGGSRRWLLRKLDRSINYKKNNNTWYNYSSLPADPAGAAWTERIMCLNCHRGDVYWGGAGADAPATGIARVNHVPGATNNSNHQDGSFNVWGTVCMNCHGGQTVGTIHGTGGAPGDTAAIPSAPRLGRRLIYGATWDGYTVSTSQAVQCTNKAVADSVGSCTNHSGSAAGGGASYVANYNY